MRALDTVTLLLVVVGALNWGLVGAAQFDLVATLFGLEFGQTSPITSAIYLLVAASGLVQAARLFNTRAVYVR